MDYGPEPALIARAQLAMRFTRPGSGLNSPSRHQAVTCSDAAMSLAQENMIAALTMGGFKLGPIMAPTDKEDAPRTDKRQFAQGVLRKSFWSVFTFIFRPLRRSFPYLA